MRRRYATAAAFMLFLLVCGPMLSSAAVCTVDSTGTVTSPNYTDIASALSGCRGQFPDLDVILMCKGTFSLNGVAIPNRVALVELNSLTGSPGDFTITSVGMTMDTTDYAMRPDIVIANATFSLENATDPLFVTPLVNQNFTFSDNRVNFTAARPAFISQEVCRNDMVLFTMQRNLFHGVAGQLLNVTGVSGYVVTDNRCSQCGYELEVGQSLVYIKQSDVPQFSRIFNFNDLFRTFNCRALPRCLYGWPTSESGLYARCNLGHVECYDEVRTMERGSCPLVPITLVDPVSSASEVVMEPDPSCRVYGPCVCSTVTYANTSRANAVIQVSNGNLVYGGNTVRVVLPCRPRLTDPFGKRAYLYQHSYFRGERFDVIGEDIDKFPGSFNDKASSITVGAGYTLTLCVNSNCTGKAVNVTGQVSNFRNIDLNDRVSAVRWVPTPWSSYNVPLWNSTFDLPLPAELDVDLGYYSALWRQPANLALTTAKSPLRLKSYSDTLSEVRPSITFQGGNVFFMFFDAGQIVPRTCPVAGCQMKPGGDGLPCEYTVYEADADTAANDTAHTLGNTPGHSDDLTSNSDYLWPYPVTDFDAADYVGAQCLSGDVYCCKSPSDAAPYKPAYAVHCSQSPNATIPVIGPDGELVAPLTQVPDRVYHCTYLTDCHYSAADRTLEGCTQFHCGLSPCRLNVTYEPTDDCYELLHIGQPEECRADNPDASTDRTCSFLLNGCERYYYNGYPKLGYVFADEALASPGAEVIPSVCEFRPEHCAAYVASEGAFSTSDTLCYCSNCQASYEATVCALTATVASPLPGRDAHCFSAVLAACASPSALTACVDGAASDACCLAARAACNWTQVPPYEGVVHGAACYAAVQSQLSSGVSTADCLDPLFDTTDAGCLTARQACQVERLTRPPNLPCLRAVMSGGTAPPASTNSTAFPAPATAPPTATSPPEPLDACFDLAVPAPNATCATARATCYVYAPQPYVYPDPSCYYARYVSAPFGVALHDCMDADFVTGDAACLAARAACSDRRCFDALGLGAGSALSDCSNPYASDDEVDSLCVWHRKGCAAYYDLGTLALLPGYCFSSDTTCVGSAVPGGCELDADACAASGDRRCTCSDDASGFSTAPSTHIHQVADVVYGRAGAAAPYVAPPDSNGRRWPVFEPSTDPVRLPQPLRFAGASDAHCPTRLWAACSCPPMSYQHASAIYQSCENYNGTNRCEPDSYSYDVAAADFSNATIHATTLYTWPRQDYSTTAFNQQIGVSGLYCSARTKLMKCDCSFSRLVNNLDPPRANTSGVFLDNVQFNDTDLQIVDNAVCDYYYGLRQDQADATLQRQKMFSVPGFADSYSVMRDVWRNPNDYILGQFDYVTEPHSYDPRYCNGGCPQTSWEGLPDHVNQEDADYIIDCGVSPQSPAYGTTIFKSFYHISVSNARGDGKRVYVRDCGKAYVEPLAYQCPPSDSGCAAEEDQDDDLRIRWTDKHTNWVFFSYDAPKVIVANMQIETPKAQGMTFQGIHFQHTGETRDRLIRLVDSKGRNILTHLYFLNCEFDGIGVTGSGILSIDGEVRTLVFSHCTIMNWNVEALNANRVRNFVFVGNMVSKVIGNAIQVRVIDIYAVRDNTWLDSRGGGKVKGAALLTITSTYDLFDYDAIFAQSIGADIPELARTCKNTSVPIVPPYFPGAVPRNLSDPYTTWQLQCAVWNNVAKMDLLDDDFPDTFIEIWDGYYNRSLLRGNSVFKAQFGIALYGVNGFDPLTDAFQLALDNPLVRPSGYRSPDAPAGADYKGITPQTWVEFTFGLEPRARDTWSADWPANGDIAQAFREGNISCVVSNSYSERTIEDSYHFNVLWYQYRWAFGFAEFRNGSLATLACNDFREYGLPPVPASQIYFLPWSGSEYVRDNVTLFRNVRLLGDPASAYRPGIAVVPHGTNVTVYMDQGVPLPTPCSQANGVKPCIRSQGNTVSTLLARFDDLCWQPFGSSLGINLWSTGGTAPVSFESYRCDYDGRHIIPLSNVYAVLIYCGTILPGNDQTAPQETDELPLPTACTVIFNDNHVDNFTSYDASAVAVTARGRVRRVKLTNYPFASGPVFIALNSLNAASSITCINNTISNIDRTALTVRNFINATIEDNVAYNCSMRSIGNTACMFFEGNPAYSTEPDVSNDHPPGRAWWTFNRNSASQEKTALTPYGANSAFPVLMPGAYFRAFPENTTLCMFNNSITTYPIAARFTDFNFTVLRTCPAPGQVIGFPDAQRYLRFVAENNFCENPDLNGTVHDLEISFAGTALEAIRDAIFCDMCCPPGPPAACWVDSSTILFNPSHPWWDWAVFNSYNRAIERCNVSSGVIYIVGQSDPFLAFDGMPAPFHEYTEVFDAVVPPPYANQSATLTIVGDVGMRIRANGHRLSNPNNRTVVVKGIDFADSGAPAPALWDFTDASLVTNDITIRDSTMIGDGTTTNRALDGTFDGRFSYTGNNHVNYSTTFSNVRMTSEDCDAVLTASHNTFSDQYGNVLEVHANNGFFNGNRFVRCGGSPAPSDTERWVMFVNPVCVGVVGEIRVNGNRFTAPPAVDSDPSRTLWTSLFVAPVPWNLNSNFLSPRGPNDVKYFQFYDTRTDGLEVGMRLGGIQPACPPAASFGDPQFFLRIIMYSRFRNARVHGSVFDLYIGYFDAFEEQTRVANRAMHDLPPHIEDVTRCYHCENGCPKFSWQLASVVLLALAFALLILFCLVCGFCGERIGCCLCCPPAELRVDYTTGNPVPAYWPYWRYLFPGLTQPNLRTGKAWIHHPDTAGVPYGDQNFAARPGQMGDTQYGLVQRGVFRGNAQT